MDKSWLDAITQVGFPIVVAGYLLFRNESKLDLVVGAINNLTNAVNLLKAQIADHAGNEK